MSFSKWYISYNDIGKEPDYITTFFYKYNNNIISFQELYNIIGDDCIKYEQLEGSRLEAWFYINDNYDMNKLKAYDIIFEKL